MARLIRNTHAVGFGALRSQQNEKHRSDRIDRHLAFVIARNE